MTAAIATPHPLATAAGQKVLDAGGTAPEAVIAAGAVLTVVMPHFCGLGGDAVWTLSDRNGDSRCLLAIGQGIQRDRPKGPVPFRGPASILTTAAVGPPPLWSMVGPRRWITRMCIWAAGRRGNRCWPKHSRWRGMGLR
ncbi:gamma-glutamyltransferase (plasmid) [Ketogulonicigenium vulgare Y25]|uniref:gamma-glutamyltransferase n=1 Tax=Ketogulonicigenium vulgare TaxID=92945 RepID=UPI0001E669F1|nr:gamma-glutamyltransferase [Ketogulonicigenium vulgare]ADO44152.1 gamma-glutamyltransferase [Ketogulonicigenium vulgare Y25]